MKKRKLYLSKSKMGSTEELMRVRSLLAQYNVDVVEFVGGEYTTSILDSSDIILILPPELPKAFNYHYSVGKGQYCEIERGLSTKKTVLSVITMGEELFLGENPQLDITSINWKNDYCFVECDYRLTTLEEIFGEDIKKQVIIPTIISKSNSCTVPYLALSKK